MFFYGRGSLDDYADSPSTSAEIHRMAGEAQRAKTSVAEIEVRLDRALLTCEALWSLLRDKLNITDDELIDRITQLDLSDGKLDGKVRKTPVSCPQCNRTLSPRFNKCMYCGQLILQDPFS